MLQVVPKRHKSNRSLPACVRINKKNPSMVISQSAVEALGLEKGMHIAIYAKNGLLYLRKLHTSNPIQGSSKLIQVGTGGKTQLSVSGSGLARAILPKIMDPDKESKSIILLIGKPIQDPQLQDNLYPLIVQDSQNEL